MPLTSEQMDRVLGDFRGHLEADYHLFAVDVDHDEDGQNPAVYLRHPNPRKVRYAGSEYALAPAGRGAAVVLPVRVVKSRPIVLELARRDEPSLFDEIADFGHLVGMAGTKLSGAGGSWGTLCLSGGKLEMTFDGTTCAVNGPFVVTNSHVARRLGNKLYSFDKLLGAVDCLFDLDAPQAFDYGQAPWTSNPVPGNHFKVYNRNGANRRIAGLQPAGVGSPIGKQGARTGWTSGKATGKSLCRVRGYDGLFPCWKGTYRSDSGDCGSPVPQDVDGKWHHVGIHFASGPRFHSWDDARILASK